MALNKQGLKQGIIALQKEMFNKTEPDFELYAEKLSGLIDSFVKSGTVTVAPGIAVVTAGSPTTQAGSTTAPGTGTIS